MVVVVVVVGVVQDEVRGVALEVGRRAYANSAPTDSVTFGGSMVDVLAALMDVVVRSIPHSIYRSITHTTLTPHSSVAPSHHTSLAHLAANASFISSPPHPCPRVDDVLSRPRPRRLSPSSFPVPSV